jgi:hypothetical protein
MHRWKNKLKDFKIKVNSLPSSQGQMVEETDKKYIPFWHECRINKKNDCIVNVYHSI